MGPEHDYFFRKSVEWYKLLQKCKVYANLS